MNLRRSIYALVRMYHYLDATEEWAERMKWKACNSVPVCPYRVTLTVPRTYKFGEINKVVYNPPHEKPRTMKFKLSNMSLRKSALPIAVSACLFLLACGAKGGGNSLRTGTVPTFASTPGTTATQ